MTGYPDQVLGCPFSAYAATATGAVAQVFAIVGTQLFALLLAVIVLLLGLRERSLPGLQPTTNLPRRNQSSPYLDYTIAYIMGCKAHPQYEYNLDYKRGH